MASFIKKFSVSSPDSTVSSLLASYSIDNSNPYSNSVIHYKDKLYSSASEALEAYIEDFDLSLMSSEISTGKICISQSTPKHTEFSKHRTKERYVFEDFDEHAGLGSIASPCRRRTECDLDLISLTTDDLLTFPADGSRPFVQRSHFKSRHQSSEWNRWSLKKSTFYPYQTSSLHIEKDFCLQENDKSVANQKLHKNFSKKKHSVGTSHRYNSVSSKENPRALSFEENSSAFPVKNYPRWLTSGKSNLSVSGISSIPNFHYPIWLGSHNLFSDSASESDGQTFNIRREASSSQTSKILKMRQSMDKDNSDFFFEHNGCLDLTGDNEVAESCNYDSPDSCFQFVDSFSRHTKRPFREDQLELMLEAEKSLETSTEDLSNVLKNDDSPSTIDILEAERSWENIPVAFKSPVPVCCEDEENTLPFPKADIVHDFLEDCINEKNKLSEKADAELELCDSEMIPVTNSLQKALHHLSRLKSLVEDTSSKQEQTDDHQEDKQEEKMSDL
ncbi:lung adenoma susceptibility protein 2 homolog isoform X2 [Dromaius novaehollandiae]|uniref:lung adenoma susceptibility protein 2 homolog isoform X2 n=1 Tax=Dromaius novaehollandiae TaxID=8790 RepID=UPI00311FBA1C